MPANKNALLRYKTIDKCLSNPYRTWSLDDLIDRCSEALYDCEGIDKGISRRTIQADIQMMRSDKLGYNAPIEVYDHKYYRYSDPEYTITQMPLSQHDLDKLSEVMDILKQFKGFSHFQELTGMVQKIEDKLYSERNKQKPVIVMETNEQLKGLEYLDVLYDAIIFKRVLNIVYRSFKARCSSEFYFHPYLLREFKNRWFVVGKRAGNVGLVNLALDRIQGIEANSEIEYAEEPGFDPERYYKHTIGVTVINRRPQNVHILVDHANAPYVMTKPLHTSQEVVRKSEEGVEIKICVHLNYELEREILGFGESMQVIKPEALRRKIHQKLSLAARRYNV